MESERSAPIQRDKYYGDESAFSPDNLLREARRQKGLANVPVPPVCVLDPDGDLVRRLQGDGRCTTAPDWACYHTQLFRFVEAGIEFGVVPFAVGAPFAVLVAEELCVRLPVADQHDVGRAAVPVQLRRTSCSLSEHCATRASYHYLPPSNIATPTPNCCAGWMVRLVDCERTGLCGRSLDHRRAFPETEAAIATMKARPSGG